MNIIKTVSYKVFDVLPGYFMSNFGAFREARERIGLSVQRKCFCCDKTFKDGDKIRLVSVRGGNKLFCTNCATQAEEQLKKESEAKNENKN